MTSIIWPSGMPQEMLRDNYKEQMADRVKEGTMDSGRPRRRPLCSAARAPMTVSMIVTPDQVESIWTPFFYTTLAGGTLDFLFPHPRRQTHMTVGIKKGGHSLDKAAGADFMLTLQLEVKV